MIRGWGDMWKVIRLGYRGGLNLYAYVDGNPLNYVDPLGLANSGPWPRPKPSPPSPYKNCECRAAGGGNRAHPESRKGNPIDEKICTYKCKCTDKCGGTKEFTITYSAGFSASAACIGQVDVPPDWTQPGQIPSTDLRWFDFDPGSPSERNNPFSSVPNGFIDKLNGTKK
jgi:hypothetical protein